MAGNVPLCVCHARRNENVAEPRAEMAGVITAKLCVYMLLNAALMHDLLNFQKVKGQGHKGQKK